tara:strand:+ start:2743 stop:3513 length:771 start_codon:yes stop_codon:yes gene_type:complete
MIFCPSTGRSKTATTHRYLSETVYVVAECEAEAYRATGKTVMECPDEVQGNPARVRNWILDNCGDVTLARLRTAGPILILDDDIRWISRWENQRECKLKPAEAMEFIEHGFSMAEQMGAKMWGVSPIRDKGAYMEYNPVNLTKYIGSPFHAHLNNECRYDEELPLKLDYDMSLQVLNRYRRILRFNAFYLARAASLRGGCSRMRTLKREKDQFRRLQQKWGRRIVRRDGGENRQKTRRAEKIQDTDPILKVPIGGV